MKSLTLIYWQLIDITAYSLAKAVGEYLQSTRASETVAQLIASAMDTEAIKERSTRIRARTARRWLHRLGLEYKTVAKGVFIDGHEREDVVRYRQEEFIPAIDRLRDYFVTWNLDGEMVLPPNLPPGEKPHILVTHDESTFNANDGKRKLWMEKGKQPIRPKGKGKGIMVSDFITAGGRLMVPWTISDEQLHELGLPHRYATVYLEYSKDNYWTSDSMIDHAIQIALAIFQTAFPGCIAVFAFDNASNHACFASDALRAEKLNKGPGGAQPLMREGFNHHKGLPQAMQFPQNYRILDLAGKPKGLKQILKERVLWDQRYCTMQGAMAGLGVDLKDGVVLEGFLLQSEIFLNNRVDYRRKLKLVVIK